MAKWFVQLRLLLWKNFLIQSRRKLSTTFEVLLPIFFVFILLILRITTIKVTRAGQDIWPAFALNKTIPLNKTSKENNENNMALYGARDSLGDIKPNWTIAYAPKTATIDNIMRHLPDFLDAEIQGFSDGDTLSEAVVTDEEHKLAEQSFLCGVEFTSGDNKDHVKYTLRFPTNSRVKFGDKKLQKVINFVPTKWYTQFVYPFTFGGMGPRNENLTVGGPPPYFREGFLSVQYAVDMAIVKSQLGSNRTDFPKVAINMRRFPYRDTIRDGFIIVIQNSLPLLLMLSLVYSALVIVKNIVHEKEKRLKESMKMMGLRNWLHWMAWFLKCFVFLLIPISICTIMLCVRFGSKNRKMLTHSDGSLIFVFLLLYAVSGIMFCFFVSTLFYRANIAAAGGGILWFLAYTPYFFLFNYYQQMSDSSRLLACFDFQVAMAFGGYLIGQFEGQGRGVQWSTITQGVTVDQNFSFGQVLLMQVVDCFLYGILAWYIENVFPGEYGIPKRFYFPFSRKYWCDIQETDKAPLIDNDTLQENFDPDEDDENVFEKCPVNAKSGIRIHNLRKIFNTEAGTKVAVDKVSLKMLKGQITALLGHNGAGKTTTISMLTGLFPPTSGTAVVNGYDIVQNMSGVRESLGICPQHNVLFDTLTVEEHLTFFTILKGVTDKKSVKNEVERMIESIGLLDKRKAESRNLSGGMKRKLSVGCALVGNSKVVILDEPTSGMDVSARRFTWDLLQRERRGRTILLTTHFMDEADVLGDRIAIMAGGKIKCCGSSLYLKKKYGVGYHMVMVKDQKCNPTDVNNVIVKYVPTAQLESNIGFELSFILPSEFSANFEQLFTEIEERRQELGILSYGASVTTLEEVFIKVGEEQDDEAGRTTTKALFRQLSGADVTKQPHETPQRMSMDDLSQSQDLSVIKNSGSKLFAQRWYAMFVKKILHSKRHKSSIISQLVMPSIFVLLSLIVVKTLPNATKSPARLLDLTMFGKRQTVPYCSSMGRNGEPICSESSQTLSSNFKSVLRSETNADGEFVSGKSMVYHLIGKEKKKDLGQFNLLYPIGFEVQQDEKTGYNLTAWFNNEAIHTPAVALNFLSNIVLRNFTSKSSARIETTNFPLPPTPKQSNKDTSMNPAGFQIGFSLCFGMAFLASSFIVFLVQERSSKAKHLQFVSGVDPISYWTSSYLWDLINFMLPCIVIMILFVIFSIDAYSGERLGYVALLLLLYGWAIIPMMYIFSYFFEVASTAFTRMTILNVITGLATLLIVYILSIPSLDLLDVAKILKWVFLALPNYNLGQGMVDLFNNYQFQHAFQNENTTQMCIQLAKSFPGASQILNDTMIGDICTESLRTYHRGHIDVDTCIKQDTKRFPAYAVFLPRVCEGIEKFLVIATSNFQWDYLSWNNPGIGRFLIFLAIEGVLFFSIVLLVEYHAFRRGFSVIVNWFRHLCSNWCLRRRAVYVVTNDHQLDSDVLNEKIRVDNQHRGNEVLLLRDLTKVFRQRTGQPLIAVDHLSLGIPHGECFGLLGQNGAGKTTTFRILTGDETMSSGAAYIDSYDVTKDLSQVRQRMGYCPQFDALIDLMTGRELLWMFCRLRGVPEAHIPRVVKKLANELSVYEHIDKCTKTYSGGNKRKLSTAIALCGDPPLIFLDEPSSGMDPVARRMLWNSLSRVIMSGKSIVITSHSMEECEALCTRVAIMVNGQFKCLGSPQHLKNKFGEGYTLIARIGESKLDENTSKLKAYLEEEFPGSLLKDEHQGYVHYQLKAENKTWANLFGIMEGAKQQYNIEDYSISQTTLEQVFLNFTRSQREVED